MRILVFSDTHGNSQPMIDAVERHTPDMVLHLGDGARDVEELRERFPALDIRSVRGNCDLLSAAPAKQLLEVEGLRILMTHGHEQSVKFTLDSLLNTAHFSGAQLALFGHTHQAEYRRYDQLALLNPGSAGKGELSCGLLTIQGGSWQWKLEYL